MTRNSATRRSCTPVIVLTATALTVAAITTATPTPTRLHAQLAAHSTTIVSGVTQLTHDAESTAPTVVKLLARSADALGSATVHELALVVSNPAATAALPSTTTPAARPDADQHGGTLEFIAAGTVDLTVFPA